MIMIIDSISVFVKYHTIDHDDYPFMFHTLVCVWLSRKQTDPLSDMVRFFRKAPYIQRMRDCVMKECTV